MMRNYRMLESYEFNRSKPLADNYPFSDVSFPLSENIMRGEFMYDKKRRTTEADIESENEPIKGKTTIIEQKRHVNLFALGFSVFVVMILAVIAGVTFARASNYTTFYRFFNSVEAEEKEPYKAMVVIEPNTSKVLDGFNESARLPMASTTKIMTAIVAIENAEDLEKTVPAPKEAVGIEGTSIYLRTGEVLSIRDLLYGLILASGNDSATALAVITAGSEEAFVEMMNNKASELGLSDTHFVNPHGLHDDNHYTTALDLAKITAYALKNDTFREIVSTKRHTISATEYTKERYLKNKQKLLFDEELNSGELQITGVKSGYTPEAGRCLVTSGYIKDMNAVCVVLNCPQMFEESKRLMVDNLNKYNYTQIIEPYSYLSNLPVVDGDKDSINVFTEAGFSYPTKIDGSDEVKSFLEYPEKIIAPVDENQEVGFVKVMINGEEVFSEPIKSMEEVKNIDFGNITKNLIEEFI